MELSLLDKKSSTIIKDYMPDSKTLAELSAFFSAFSDATRIKILAALSVSPMCVGDLAIILDINQTTLSHQLKLLKSSGIVDCTRQGKVVFYELTEEDTVNELMCAGAEYVSR